LERFDRDLHEELCGIAEGADLRPEDIVVLNHYTDLRDIDPDAALGRPPGGAGPIGPRTEDGCTALWIKAAAGPVLAQTWDMHATAMPYVMLLEVPEIDGAPGALLFSLTGCLGMCGVN